MAMRRPRIRPVANIQFNSKRKSKSAIDAKIVKVGESDVNCERDVVKKVDLSLKQGEESPKSTENSSEVRENSVDTAANINNLHNDIKENENNAKEPYLAEDLKDQAAVNNVEKINENYKDGTIKKILISNRKEQHSKNSCEEVTEILNDSDAFKFPPKVGFQRAISHTSNSGIDDVFYSDIEENALQMDLENPPSSNSCPMSPSKTMCRQRIRPTPHFGQRRNSFVGSPSPHTLGNEDNHITNSSVINEFSQTTQARREKHSSAFTGNSHLSSHHYYHHTPHKYLPAGIINSSMGRIRTESGCSVFSDTNTSSYKSRKTEEHKQNSRKDFEARFHNGVPEKSAIKMSDLIYYNPATNPMEQKPNSSVKLEHTDTSSKDIKPFTEKLENDTDTFTGNEAIPVPQLKLNAKGELILDDKSLVIETTAEQEARKVLANSSLIYLDENTGMNGFYSRKKRTREWVPSETIKFYRCLQNVGTDFSLMVSLFPNRTRRDLKLKFKKEERKNTQLINKALLYPKQFDIEALKQQMDDEEKLREVQAKKAKTTRASKVKTTKESKKRKVSNISVANRVLINEDVYQNENDQKTKKVRKTNIKKDISVSNTNDSIEQEKCKKTACNEGKQEHEENKMKNAFQKLNGDQVTINNNFINNDNNNIQISETYNADKRRRKRTPNKVKKEEIIIIKEEIIKVENKQESNQTTTQTEDTKQLQTEIDELLDSDAVDIPYNSTTYETSTENCFPITSQTEQYNERAGLPPCLLSHTKDFDEDCIEMDTDNNKYEHRTFMNLDDGSVNVYSNVKDDTTYVTTPATTLSSPNRSQPPQSASLSVTSPIENKNISLESTIPEPDIINTETCSSVISERELNEDDIQSILTELAEGSLVLVSSLDPDDPDKVLNEIFMVDKNTGDLCEEPLSIPDNIVQCILTVVS